MDVSESYNQIGNSPSASSYLHGREISVSAIDLSTKVVSSVGEHHFNLI